jgi:DNA-binding transcriptional MerR regulator
MEFSQISRARRKVLLAYGLGKGVLIDFVDKKRKLLLLSNSGSITRGLDNPKISVSDAAKKISQFDAKSDPTIRDYFEAHFASRSDLQSLISADSVQHALSALMAAELGLNELPDAEREHCCEVLFATVMHAEVDTDSVLFKYLASDIGRGRERQDEQSPVDSEATIRSEIESVLGIEDISDVKLESWTDLALVFGALRPGITDAERILIAQQAVRRVVSSTENSLDGDSIDSMMSKLKGAAENGEPGARVEITHVDYRSELDLDAYDGAHVLAAMKDATPHDVRFLEPLAVLIDKNFYSAPRNEFKRLFPESGDLVWPSKSDFKGVQPGDIGLYFVEVERGSTHKNSAIVRRSEKQLSEVISAAVESTDLTALRRYFMLHGEEIARKRLFILTQDQVLLRPKYAGNLVDIEEPVSRFSKCSVLSLGNQLFLDHPGIEDGTLDICSPKTYINRLFKAGFFSKAGISNADVKKIVEALASDSVNVPTSRVREIEQSLEAVLTDTGIAAGMLSEIVDRGLLQEMVDAKIDDLTASHRVGREALDSEIKQLTKSRDELQRSIQKLEEEHKKDLKRFSAEWRKEFDRSVEKSAEKLAELAWFKGSTDAISVRTSPSPDLPTPTRVGIPIVTDSIRPVSEPIKALASQFSLEGGLISSFFDALKVMSRAGMCFVFRGPYSRTFGRQIIARMNLSEAKEYFVEPGMVRPLEEFSLELSGNRSVGLLINSFDVSPISLYAPSLVDELQRVFFSKADFNGLITFTSDESGVSLQMPESLAISACVVDLVDLAAPINDAIDSIDQKIRGAKFLSRHSMYAAQSMWSKLTRCVEDGSSVGNVVADLFDRGYLSRYCIDR